MIEVLKRPIESDYTSHVAYTRALEQYCDSLESQEQPKQVNELHTCPYREVLHGDYETLCACDAEATHQCAMSI